MHSIAIAAQMCTSDVLGDACSSDVLLLTFIFCPVISPLNQSISCLSILMYHEWCMQYILSGAQYNILRKGGTERQKSSILNTFTNANVGIYTCAGCNTPLFSSADKFSSGTGWPSFSTALEGVEEEELDPIRATLDGKEVRCATCGGHLGDLFNDGWIYRGTSAAKMGKRYCIDGAALIFKPEGGGEDVFGDIPPPNKVIKYEQSMYRDV